MYKIELPLLGFEDIKQLSIKEIDDNFSTLILDEKKKLNINLVNISYFKKVNFNFNIEDEILEKLHIHELKDFEIYFCVVMQTPVEDSIVNLAAPVLINHKQKLIGQYVIKDRIPQLLTTLESNII